MQHEAPILPRAVRRDIVVLICLKLIALTVLYQLFFKPYEQSSLTAGQIADKILSAPRAP